MADDLASAADPVPVGLGEADPQKTHEYTGQLQRANADGTEIKGWLIDQLGCRITLRGHRDPRKGKGYFLYGEVTEIPAHLRVPAIDEGR